MSRGTFFDSLEVDVLPRIVRLNCVCSIFQPLVVDSSFFDLLFDQRSPFSRATHLLFNHLRIKSGDYLAVDLTKRCLYMGDTSVDFARILPACGRSFKVVSVYGHESLELNADYLLKLRSAVKNGAKLEYTIMSRNTNRNLTLFIQFLNKYITSLKIETQESSPDPLDTGAIMKSAMGLMHLEEFAYSGADVNQLAQFWNSFGCSLKFLQLNPRQHSNWNFSTECMDAVKEGCPNLRHINIQGVPPQLQTDYVDFLTTYGSQLESADVLTFNDSEIQNLVKECPNLRLRWTERRNEFHYLESIANCVRELDFSLHMPTTSGFISDDWTSFSDGMNACINLYSLTVVFLRGFVPLDLMKSLFVVKNLESLQISFNCAPTKVALETMMIGCPMLKSLTISSREFIDEAAMESFREIPEGLQSLVIVETEDAYVEERDSFGMLLKLLPILFKRTPSLSNFTYATENTWEIPSVLEMKSLCRPLHMKQIKYFFRFANFVFTQYAEVKF